MIDQETFASVFQQACQYRSAGTDASFSQKTDTGLYNLSSILSGNIELGTPALSKICDKLGFPYSLIVIACEQATEDAENASSIADLIKNYDNQKKKKASDLKPDNSKEIAEPISTDKQDPKTPIIVDIGKGKKFNATGNADPNPKLSVTS